MKDTEYLLNKLKNIVQYNHDAEQDIYDIHQKSNSLLIKHLNPDDPQFERFYLYLSDVEDRLKLLFLDIGITSRQSKFNEAKDLMEHFFEQFIAYTKE